MKDEIHLIADRLKNDPKILQSIDQIEGVIASYQKGIVTIRPPQSHLEETYDEILNTFTTIRGNKLYFPYLGSGWGRGPLVELLDGSIKYDMISGIGPHFWGHSYPPLIKVAIEASLSNTIMQGHLQQNYDAFLLSEALVQASNLDHCFLTSSGAMANENALKIIFQNKFPASRLLAFEHCFMGRTLALSQITDKPAYRQGLPSTLNVDYVPFYNAADPKRSTERALEAIHTHLKRYPGEHAAMCFELVQGEGGFKVGDTSFFTAIIKLLKEHDIRIFIDEVQTFGRTSELFAYQHYQLEEYVDVVCVGKLSQVCATLFRAHMNPKPGLLSQTFTSSTVAIQSSYWIIKQLMTNDYYGPRGRVMQLHTHFEDRFKELEKKLPGKIKGPYGIGAMVTFTPFDGEAKRVGQFVQDLFHAGVISFVAGSHPTRVRFLLPAGIMTVEEVDAVVKIVEEVLSQG